MNIQLLDVWRLPDIGVVADDLLRQSADGEQELTLFERPTTVVADEGEVAGWQTEGDGARLAGLQLNLRELTQATAVGHHRSHEVAAVEQHALLAGTGAAVGNVDADGEHVTMGEVLAVNAQVAVAEGGVAQTGAEAPLLGDAGVIVVGALHGAGLLALLEVVVGKRVDL